MSELRPIGHRLLVLPDRPSEHTTSGIYIPDAYNDTPAMSGIVVRVGSGYERDRRIRSAAIARCMAILDDSDVEAATGREAVVLAKEEMARYLRDAGGIESVASVGQRVVFPMEAGHELVLGEDSSNAMVLVAEDSVLAVFEGASVAA